MNRKTSGTRGSPRQRAGWRYEDLACRYLRRAGLTLVERNFHCRAGEIDLVCRDGATLVFVEVRFRRGNRYGHAVETVDRRKQRRLILAAQYYLQSRGLHDKLPCRFDVVGISLNDGIPECRWIAGAFQ